MKYMLKISVHISIGQRVCTELNVSLRYVWNILCITKSSSRPLWYKQFFLTAFVVVVILQRGSCKCCYGDCDYWISACLKLREKEPEDTSFKRTILQVKWWYWHSSLLSYPALDSFLWWNLKGIIYANIMLLE